jgi:predicted transcriptional regulator of viral defense system
VLAELAERIDATRLAEAARADGEIVYSQRLGYLLDLVGAHERTEGLTMLVAKKGPRYTPLRAGQPVKGCPVDERWRVTVNEQVEIDQ